MQAALSVARRVAEEMDTDVGAEVGYSVRFDERTSARTRIVYLTGELNTASCIHPFHACVTHRESSPQNHRQTLLADHAILVP